MPSGLEGYVLAGGASSRMGSDKSQIEFGGRTLAEHAAEMLSQVCTRVTIAGGQGQASFPTISDPYSLTGRRSRASIVGLSSALSHSRTEWTVVLACDLPFVTPDFLHLLIKKARAAAKGISVVVPEQADGRLQPLAAVYRTAEGLIAALEMIGRGDLRLQTLLGRLDPIIVTQSEIASVGDPEKLFFNINTPADLEKALNIETH